MSDFRSWHSSFFSGGTTGMTCDLNGWHRNVHEPQLTREQLEQRMSKNLHSITESSHDCARPLAVMLALVLLGFNIAVALFMRAVYTGMNPPGEIKFLSLLLFVLPFSTELSFFALVFVLPFCFLVLGKNWARWLVAILTLIHNGFSVLWWEHFRRTYSVHLTIWFWLTVLMDLVGVVLLFHPSSNRWFRHSQSLVTSTPTIPLQKH